MSEQQFFQDPAVDSLLEALLGLAAELHVTRTRQRALESLLNRSGIVAEEALADWTPSPEEAEALELERDQLIKTLFGAIATRGAKT